MKTTRVFKSGNSMAVRLPKNMDIKGKDLTIEKYGDMVILVPANRAWKTFLESLNEFSDDVFAGGREQGTAEKREPID